MATVRCKCGNTYFARVSVNQFKNNAVTLHSSMHEVEPDHDIKIYQCINTKCGQFMMPPINYYNTAEDDKELYTIVKGAIEGEIIEPKPKHRAGKVHPGTVSFVGGDNKPEEHGKFVPVGQ
jgi:hypothetical protein